MGYRAFSPDKDPLLLEAALARGMGQTWRLIAGRRRRKPYGGISANRIGLPQPPNLPGIDLLPEVGRHGAGRKRTIGRAVCHVPKGKAGHCGVGAQPGGGREL